MKTRTFKYLALLALAHLFLFFQVQDSFAQGKNDPNLPEVNKVGLTQALDKIDGLFKKVTSGKKTILGFIEVDSPAVKDYFRSELPKLIVPMEKVRNKLYEKSRFRFEKESEIHKDFIKEAIYYNRIYIQFVKTYIQAMHNDGNNTQNYIKRWHSIESLRPKFHANSYDDLAMRFEEFKIINHLKENYFEVAVSEFQKSMFESEALKNITTVGKYARSVHFHALQSTLFNHVDLQSYVDYDLPPEFAENSCAGDSFLSMQTPPTARGNMLELPLYKETQNYLIYNNFYFPYTKMFTKIGLDAGIMSEEFISSFMDKVFENKNVRKFFKEKFKKNEEYNEGKEEAERVPTDKEGYQKYLAETFSTGYRNIMIELDQGNSVFQKIIKPGEELSYEIIRDRTFELLYNQANALLYEQISNRVTYRINEEDDVKLTEEQINKKDEEHFNKVYVPVMNALRDYLNENEAAYKERYTEAMDKVEGFRHLKDRRSLAAYMKQMKIDRAAFLAMDVLPSAYLVNLMNNDYLMLENKREPLTEEAYIRKLSTIATPKFFYEEGSDVKETEGDAQSSLLERRKKLMLQRDALPPALRNVQKVLPVEPGELILLAEKKADLPRFMDLRKTISHDQRGMKLWDYFQKRIRTRVKDYKKEVLKKHDLDDFIQLDEEAYDDYQQAQKDPSKATMASNERAFFETLKRVLPKELRIELLNKAAVEEGKRIYIGFIRRFTCENLNDSIEVTKKSIQQFKGKKKEKTLQTWLKRYENLFTFHQCENKDLIKKYAMSDEEIDELTEELGYDKPEDLIDSFIYDQSEDIKEYVNTGNKSLLDQSLNDPSNSLLTEAGASLNRQRKKEGKNPIEEDNTVFEQELIEVLPEKRFRKSWWEELGQLLVDAAPMILEGITDIFHDDIWDYEQEFDSGNFIYKLLGDTKGWFWNWDWRFGKLKKYDELEFHFQTEKQQIHDMYLENVARHVFREQTGNEGFLMGDDKALLIEKIEKQDEKDKEAYKQALKDKGIGEGVEVADSKEDLVKKEEEETETVSNQEIDEISALIDDVLDLDGLLGGSKANGAFGSNIEVVSSEVVQAELELERQEKELAAKKDSANTKPLVLKPEFREDKKDSTTTIDETIAKAQEQAKEETQRVAEFTMPETAARMKKEGFDVDGSKLEEEAPEEEKSPEEKANEMDDYIASNDPLLKKLDEQRQAAYLDMKGLGESTGKLETFNGDASLFEQKDLLRLLKVSHAIVNGKNYIINHYGYTKKESRGKFLKNLGETFDEMLKVYGLAEVVILGGSEEDFDLAPTMMEQFMIASSRVEQAKRGDPILGIVEELPAHPIARYDYFQKLVDEYSKNPHASEPESNKKSFDDYLVSFGREGEEDAVSKALILRLAESYDPHNSSNDLARIKDEINHFISRAVTNISGKIADFCEAELDYPHVNDAYGKMFRSSGGIRRYLFSAQNTAIDPVMRKTIEVDYEEDMMIKTRSRMVKNIEMLDYIGMAVLFVGFAFMGAAGWAARGLSAETLPKWVESVGSWWGIGFGSGAKVAGAMGWLSKFNLFLTFFFVAPNTMRIIDVYSYPAQIKFQKSLMTAQVLESTFGEERAVIGDKEIEETIKEYNMNKIMGPLFLAFDGVFIGYTAKMAYRHFGFAAADYISMQTGVEFTNIFAFSRWKEWRSIPKYFRAHLEKFKEVRAKAAKIKSMQSSKRIAESSSMDAMKTATQEELALIKLRESTPLTRFMKKISDGIRKYRNTSHVLEQNGKNEKSWLKNLVNDYKTIKLMKTKEGMAALRSYLTGMPILDQSEVLRLLENDLVARAGRDFKLKSLVDAANHRQEFLEGMTETIMETIPKSAQEASNSFKDKVIYNSIVRRKLGDRISLLIDNPRMSWKLLMETFGNSRALMYPPTLIKAIKRRAWDGAGAVLNQFKWHFRYLDEMKADLLKDSAREFSKFTDLMNSMDNFFRKNPQYLEGELSTEAIEEIMKPLGGNIIKIGQEGKVFENEMGFTLALFKYAGKVLDEQIKVVKREVMAEIDKARAVLLEKNVPIEQVDDILVQQFRRDEINLLKEKLRINKIKPLEFDVAVEKVKRKSFKDLFADKAEKMVAQKGFMKSILPDVISDAGVDHYKVFLKTVEDLAKFNYPGLGELRNIFKQNQRILDAMEPLEHEFNLEYYINNMSSDSEYTIINEFIAVRESMTRMVNGQLSPKSVLSVKKFDEFIYSDAAKEAVAKMGDDGYMTILSYDKEVDEVIKKMADDAPVEEMVETFKGSGVYVPKTN